MKENYTSSIKAEQQLIKALKERQPKAINDFYDRYAPALYGTIKKSLLNESVSNETLIATFKVICSSIEKFDPTKEPLFTWAAKIARKEINKQKIELILTQLFPCKSTDLVIQQSYVY